MQIETWPVDRPQPYDKNPRLNDDAVEVVAKSIREFGFRQPIVVDEAGVVIIGHTRLKAAKSLGLVEVPVHVARGLSPEQVKALRIADNKTAEIAEWNLELLPIELAELQGMNFDLGLLWFDQDELAKLLDPEMQQGLCDPDEIPAPPDEAITNPGDLWILGEHRLLCGDSSKPADLDRLLDGQPIHLCNTDPPYNVKVEPRSNNAIAAGLSSLWKVIRSGIFAVGMAVVPLLQDWALAAIQVAKVTSDWVRNNQQLIVTVFKVLVGIVAVGAAIMGLGVLVYGTGAAFGIAASLITGVGAVLGTIGTVIAALLSPIGLVSVAIAGLAGYLLYASGLGAQALQWLGDEFQALKADALTAWQGIGDALAAGDLSLAAKILWLTLKMEWQKGVAFLEEHWAKFKETFLSIATDAFYGVVGLLVNAWSGLQSAWIETTAFLADAWTVFTSGLTKGWSTAQNFISKGVLRLMKLFDSSLDVEAASKILDENFAAQNAASDQQRNQQISQRDQRKQEQLAQIEQQRQSAQDEIGQMAADSHAARQQQNQDDLQASGEAISKARQEWEAAIADAAMQRQQADANAPDRLRRAQQDLEGMDDLLSQIGQDKVSVKGTFNALGARGLGSEGPAERTAKATEETAKNTKKILQEAQHGGLVFD